ncbi:MAG: efflux RND transporter periplasmic adaptor subunit [Anaerolineae bacterium]|nr:efflux RND transporter periplasmic adaptor subunit [Anaerolineae bacterium]
MKRRIIIIVAAVVVVLVAIFGFIQYNRAQSANNSRFQTVALERGPLTSLIGATGTVRANQTTLLNWQTSGRISKIYVAEGDQVKKGAELAALDPASLPQTVILAQADLVNARRSLDNLKNSETAKAQAALNLANAKKAVDDAKDKRAYKDYQRASNATIDQARANYILAKKSYDDAKEAYDAVAGMADDSTAKAAALSAMASNKLALDKVSANLNWLLGKPDEIEVAQADATLEVAQAQLEDAQREWDRLKDGVDPEDLKAAQAKVDAIEATLAYTSLTAPINGVVTSVNSKIGDQVSAGLSTFRIDDFSHLLVDVEVPEVDINKIQPGQPATLTFDAIQDKIYNGKVTEVSKVGVTSSGVVNYTVTVELTDADEAVLTGMTASVNVVVQQLDKVLLTPNRAVKRINGKTYIYILKNEIPQRVEITLGAYSDTNSEIASGEVNEGDLIVLNPPAEMQTMGGPPRGD